jgi:thymidylate synthase
MRSNNYFIYGVEPKNVWKRGLNLIIEKGLLVDDERGSRTREILNLITRIENPFGEYPKEIRERLLKEYGNTLLTPENKGFSYTYGERLRNWNGLVDQIDMIIKRINNNRNTRRAIATTWIPTIDFNTEEVPCMMLVDFKLRDRLELTAIFRSHDFYGAYPYNLYALSKLLEYVAKETDAKKGGITIQSISAHIYLNDLKNVEAIL